MVRRAKDGTTWRTGTDAEVAWIVNGTSPGRTITAAIPPVFEAYATVPVAYSEERDVHDRALLTLLREQSPGQRLAAPMPQRSKRLAAGRGTVTAYSL